MKLSNMLTEPDNVTLCPVRVILAMGVVGYHWGVVSGLWNGSIKFDIGTLGQYAQHILEFVAGGGAGVGIKSGFKGDAP